MSARSLAASAALLLTALCTTGTPLAAQNDIGWEGIQFEVSRERLVEVQQELTSRLSFGDLTNRLATEVRFRLDVVEDRLLNGDFREGDRVVLNVRGEAELTDTFTVISGPMVRLPGIGDVDLRGVLASEVQPRMLEAISAQLRNPSVTARAMLQLAVSGAVGAPGFYLVTADALVSDVIMMAGGPTAEADIDAVAIERGPWRPDAPEQQLTGISLDAMSVNRLGLRGGDRIVVEAEGGVSFGQVLQWTSIVAGAAASIIILTGRR
jgi:hypothetical protein